MAFIGVSDLWSIFEWLWAGRRDAYNDKQKKAEEWLDQVHRDLEELSGLWLELSSPKDHSNEHHRALTLITGPSAPTVPMPDVVPGAKVSHQRIIATRLQMFYRAASRVLPADNPFQSEFLQRLASILITRNEVRTVLDHANQPFMESPERLAEMRLLAEQLQEQLAALQVAITTFKAQPRG